MMSEPLNFARKPHWFTPEEDAILRRDYPNPAVSVRSIADALGRNTDGIYDRAKKLELSRPKSRINYDVAARIAALPTGAHRCQFIAGEPSFDDACKCGAAAVVGFPYCPPHATLCYDRASEATAP